MSKYSQPGGYSRTWDAYRGVAVAVAERVLVIIGSGNTEYTIEEVVTKGSILGSDTLAHTIASVESLKSIDGTKTYIENTHFTVSGNTIDWAAAVKTAAIMMGGVDVGTIALAITDKLAIVTNVGKETVTFAGTETNLTLVLATITATAPAGYAATALGDKIVLTSADTGDVAVLTIDPDTTADVLSALGLVVNATEHGFGEPVTGDEYQVEYSYAKADADYALKSFYKSEDWTAEYGHPVDDSVVSNMGIAGKLVFDYVNNIVLYGIQTKGDSKYDFEEALAKLELENFPSIPLLLPLTTDSDVAVFLETHCDLMSSYVERKERTGMVGHSESKFNMDFLDNTLRTETSKQLTGEFLAILVGVLKLKTINLANTITFLELDAVDMDSEAVYSDNTTISAEASAIDSKNIELVGFCSGVVRELNDVAMAGVTIIAKNSDGTAWAVRHNITTRKWASGVAPEIFESEPSSVVVRYYTMKTTRDVMIARHGGEKITPALLKSMELTAKIMMDNFISEELINAYDEAAISAEQDVTNLIKIDVMIPGIISIYNNLITEVIGSFLQ